VIAVAVTVALMGYVSVLGERGSLAEGCSGAAECPVLIQAIARAVECCRVAVCVPTDVVIVHLFLQLVEFCRVTVDDEEACFPRLGCSCFDCISFGVGCEFVVLFIVGVHADNIKCGVSVELSSHVLDDVGLVLEFEAVGVRGLSFTLHHVHESFFRNE